MERCKPSWETQNMWLHLGPQGEPNGTLSQWRSAKSDEREPSTHLAGRIFNKVTSDEVHTLNLSAET